MISQVELGRVARSGLAAVTDTIRGLLELTLPGVCALCEAPLGEQRGPVCTLCWCRMDLLPHPQCQRCGHPLPADDAAALSPCRWCDALPPFVRAVRSACWIQHGTGAARAVHALKYDGWRQAADGMATCLARLRWPADVVRERACLVPVPLTPWRERERGYNQAAELASALATHWHCPVRPVLRRTRMPASQTRLTPGERQVNVTRAFTVASGGALHVKGAHCVLVDDVVTTAATLVACAAALMDSGARIVSCVTFGRAPAIGDRRSPLE